MKRSFFYHPLIKGALLILFIASLLGGAFFGLRLVHMGANHIFAGPEGFYPGYASRYGDPALSFPTHAWNGYISSVDDIYAEDELSLLLFIALQREIGQSTPAVPKREGDHVYLTAGDALTIWNCERYDKSQTNLAFRVTDMNTGEVLFSNMEDLYDAGKGDALVMTGSSAIIFYSLKSDASLTPPTSPTDTEYAPDTEPPLETEAVTAPQTEDVGTNISTDTETEAHTEEMTFAAASHMEALTTFVEVTTDIDEDAFVDGIDFPSYMGISAEDVQRARHVDYTWGVRKEYTVDDVYSRFYEAFMYDFTQVEETVIAALVCAFLCLLSFVLLIVGTGIHRKKEGVQLSWIDQLPLELVFLCKGAALSGTVALSVAWLEGAIPEMLYYFYGYFTPESVQKEWLAALFAASGVALVLLLGLFTLWCFCGLARRIRAKTLFKNTIVYRVLQLCLRLLRLTLRIGKAYVSGLSLYWQWTILFALGFLLPLLFGRGVAAIFALILYGVVCFAIWQLSRVQDGARALADGALDHRIETKDLCGTPKAMVEDLNRIGEGMSRAVEARMQSERFRTELITNVSHDIKTPLTSIINYTDLLAKETPENERMREYIEVLSRQSARLKKLIEDLIDASKASSGAIPLSLAPLDASELLRQVLGEYEERFAKASLTPIIDTCEGGAQILADGRHMWRVFDNLMSNILKYSMPGTRVYLTVEVQKEHVHLIFKNISQNELHIDPSHLSERFVRGDASRHTEGSGLGLAIAKSLVELQGGEMRISIDADLFGVTVSFPQMTAKA